MANLRNDESKHKGASPLGNYDKKHLRRIFRLDIAKTHSTEDCVDEITADDPLFDR